MSRKKKTGPKKKAASKKFVKTSITLAPKLKSKAKRFGNQAKFGGISGFVAFLIAKHH